MRDDRLARLSRQLLILAVAASAAAGAWAARTPVAPNSDRYDYAGRARHLVEGGGPTGTVSYPLRFAFDGATALPPENITRPPLWPVLLAPPLAWGLDDRAGVVMSWVFLMTLLLLVQTATDRSLGAGAGGFAALVIATSFATTRALWGGGPELAVATFTFLLWSWAPAAAGTVGYVVCGTTYALLAWLHPIGIFYGGLAFVARSHRYSRRGRWIVALVAVLLATPWYLQVGSITHSFLGPLQSQAELAKATLDPGGLGPYRGLEPQPSFEVLRDHPGDWLRESRHRLRLHLQGLDAWWAWLLVALAVAGISRDRRLALRDIAAGTVAILVIAAVSFEARLLIPLLPIAASWSGGGFLCVAERWPRAASPIVAGLCVGLPWLLPLGTSLRPGAELDASTLALREVPPEAVAAVGDAVRDRAVLFVDSAALAYRTRQPSVLLPNTPATMHSILVQLGAQDSRAAVVLANGRDSWALRAAPSAWNDWLATTTEASHAGQSWRIYRPSTELAPRAKSAAADSVYIPPVLALGRDAVPDSLVEIAAPPASRAGLKLVPVAQRALDRLLRAANQEGLELRVISAYRSYEYQRQLHARAVTEHGPGQEWVAPAGRSEHQLGTTVDLADAALEHQVEASFATTPEGKWLAANCERFGFVLSYTNENTALSGYRPEPWHIRYRGLDEGIEP
jgi:LAS superfamily LD-carboxypeptidase LdcB